MQLFRNIHLSIKSFTPNSTDFATVIGEYDYYYYECDGIDDQGWGCGYRSLQTICSWIKLQKKSDNPVPSIKEIQAALCTMEDKPPSIVGSRDWIGSFEVSICVDFFFDVPCKILHIRSGSELKDHLSVLEKHFRTFGSPIMMGGDTDNASKCVLGVCTKPAALLILDPHCYDKYPLMDQIIDQGLIRWRLLDTFNESSFYNLCFPQLKAI